MKKNKVIYLNPRLEKLLKRLDFILNDDEKHDEYYCLDKARELVDKELKKYGW